MVHDLEHLAFDDAADAIEIGAALALEFAFVLRLLPQPKDHPYGRQDDESRQWEKVAPIGQQAIQSEIYVSAGRRTHKRGDSGCRQSINGHGRRAECGACGVCGEHTPSRLEESFGEAIRASPSGKRREPFDKLRTGEFPHSMGVPVHEKSQS